MMCVAFIIVRLSVVLPNVVMLSVVAPNRLECSTLAIFFFFTRKHRTRLVRTL